MEGFDTGYGRPCIEDIELGVRLHKTGKRIILNKDIQVTHLKRWTLRGLIKSDFWDRGVPWTELMLRSKCIPNDLNLKLSQRLSAILVVCVFLMLVVGAWYVPVLLLLALSGLLSIELIDWWTVKRKLPTAICVAMICITLAAAYAMVVRYPTAAVITIALHLVVVLINHKLYRFFAREKSFAFAVLVVPLHAIYYLYSVAAFVCGTIFHYWKNSTARSSTPSAVGDPTAGIL
jgi:hypothetical protein